MRVRIKSKGIGQVRNKLGKLSAEQLSAAIDTDLGVEARKTAMDAAEHTPVETGALQASIRYSAARERKLRYHWGSKLPYALRQEYEHKALKGWMRAANTRSKKRIVRTIKATILKRLKG